MIIDTITNESVNIVDGLPPIKVFCLGSDVDPVTSQEVNEAVEHIEKNGDLPKDWPKKTRKFKVKRSPLPGTWIIQLGSRIRPATQADVDDIKQQIIDTANNDELTIVTHHNFYMTWVEESKALLHLEVNKQV